MKSPVLASSIINITKTLRNWNFGNDHLYDRLTDSEDLDRPSSSYRCVAVTSLSKMDCSVLKAGHCCQPRFCTAVVPK